MRTVGEILKKARIERKLTFEEIEKQLRIRKKYLMALEENAWERLPPSPYIKGFLRNYSLLLGLKPEEMAAIFRRQYQEQERAGLLPTGLTHPINEPILRFTPQMMAAGIMLAFILFFFGYLAFQYKAYTSPPTLTIIKPAEGETINSVTIQIIGKTDSDAVVSINNQKIALSQNGEFATTLSLSPGVNTVAVESTSKYGKKKTVTRTIQVQESQ